MKSHPFKDLRRQRLNAGLSARALSEIIGISFSSIARIERGVGTYTEDTERRVRAWLEQRKGSVPKQKLHQILEERIRVLEERVANLEGRTLRLDGKYG